MTKNFSIPTLLLGLTFLVSCGQNSRLKPAEKFITFLNNYQADSLQILVADNFQLKRTYSTYANDRKSFLGNYFQDSKNINAKYKIIKSTNSGQTTEFLVEDQSDYLRYLNIEYPKWRLQVVTNGQEKIESMTIDTTENYQTYLTQAKIKGEEFEKWLKQKYPDEAGNLLYNTTGLFPKRLKEYSIR
jgi:hypothetical protein